MHGISLSEVLAAKERRAALREELRQVYRLPVVCISVNIPGPVKDGKQIRGLFRRGLEQYQVVLEQSGLYQIEERCIYPLTGPFALSVIDADPKQLKQIAIAVENSSAYARLYDIDVFDASGKQISRSWLGLRERDCFLCEKPAVQCMREGNHSRDDIVNDVKRRLTAFAADTTNPWEKPVWRIGSWALEAMLMEVASTPAPGLVDRNNAGAHRDMDYFTFLESSSALAGTMFRFASAGWNHAGTLSDLLPVLRRIGLAGEKDMFLATKGVNTQKGLLFLFGVLTAAAAAALRNNANPADIFAYISKVCEGLVCRELELLRDRHKDVCLTAGERLFLAYGITGIRGEIEAGLPSVCHQGLPALRQGLASGLSINDALIHTLISLMTVVVDSTIINRHGLDTLGDVQNEAKRIMDAGGMLTELGRMQISALDTSFIERNISPGGSADLLAATYFLHQFFENGYKGD